MFIYGESQGLFYKAYPLGPIHVAKMEKLLLLFIMNSILLCLHVIFLSFISWWHLGRQFAFLGPFFLNALANTEVYIILMIGFIWVNARSGITGAHRISAFEKSADWILQCLY